jgi:phospholipid-binding lipoprotein MlaA
MIDAHIRKKTVKALTQFQHYASVSLAAIILTGCASKGADRHPEDPFEPVNRQIYSLNRGVDKFLFAPVAGIYHKLLPAPVRASVTNFFSNINDINVTANQILQFKLADAFQSSTRFVINSTIGIGGLFDVASKNGVYKQRQDFGTTLAHYGWKESTYLVLPLLGATTIRDGIGLGVDWYLSPYAYIDEWQMWTALGIDLINLRSNMLEEVVYVDYVSMDSYTFVRDIYLGRRNALINNIQNTSEWDNAKWEDWEEAKNESTPTAQPSIDQPAAVPQGRAWVKP